MSHFNNVHTDYYYIHFFEKVNKFLGEFSMYLLVFPGFGGCGLQLFFSWFLYAGASNARPPCGIANLCGNRHPGATSPPAGDQWSPLRWIFQVCKQHKKATDCSVAF